MTDSRETSATGNIGHEKQAESLQPIDNTVEREGEGEGFLSDVVDKAIPLIDDEAKKALSRTEALRNQASESAGISPDKANEISRDGGFDRRFASIKEKVSPLAEKAKKQLSLLQLKLLRVKNPEQVLDLVHYFQRIPLKWEAIELYFEENESAKVVAEKERLEKLGYMVNTRTRDSFDMYSNKRKSETVLSASNENPPTIGSRQIKRIAYHLDDVANAPNDPIQFYDALQRIGYKITISEEGMIDEGFEITELIKMPNALPFLENIHSLVENKIINVDDSRFAMRYITELANQDIAENFFSGQSQQDLQRISSLQGRPIDIANLSEWKYISRNPNLIEIYALLMQKPIPDDSTEKERINKLHVIRNSGAEKEVLSLLRDGFTKESLDHLFKSYDYDQSAKDIQMASKLLTENPQLIQLLQNANKIYQKSNPFEQEWVNKLLQLSNNVPEIAPAFSKLAELGVSSPERGFYAFLGNAEAALKNKEIFVTIVEPGFEDFIKTCKGRGHDFDMGEFLGSPENCRIMQIYKDDAARTVFLSEAGGELFKYLNMKNQRSNEWNIRALMTLAAIPGSTSALSTLEQCYGYKYNNNALDNELIDLKDCISDEKFIDKLLQPQSIECAKLLKTKYASEFRIGNLPLVFEIANDKEIWNALQDPETMMFINSVLGKPNPDIRTILALSRCDPTLRPIIEKVVKEFKHKPGWELGRDNMLSQESDQNHSKLNYVIRDELKIKQLRDEPDILIMQQQLEKIGLEVDPLVQIERIKKLSDNNLFPVFEYFKSNHENLKFLWYHLDIAITLSKLPLEKTSVYLDIFLKIDASPSQEIQRLKDSLLAQLAESEKPLEDYQTIESIFIKNNIPTVGKVYKIFEALHNPSNLQKRITEKTSPVLQRASARNRYYAIYQDLLKIHIESGNRSLKEYAEILQSGGKIIDRYEHEGLESLNPREQQQLGYFVGKLETLLSTSALGTADKAGKLADVTNLPNRIARIKEDMIVPPGQTILDRVSDMYLRPVGLKSLDELLDKMKKSKTSADDRSRQMVHDARLVSATGEPVLKISEGDFLKAVDDKYIGNILQNGSVAKEFLGAGSDSDLTPLDTDISLVLPGDVDGDGDFGNVMKSSLANTYGALLFVLRDRGQYQRTVAGQPAPAEADKWELFQTKVLGERHYGIRTGVPTTEIDFMIARDIITSDQKKLQKIYYEIAQNGYYLPVTDTTGKVIFTPEMYDEYRKSFAGIDKFDGPQLDFHPTTESERTFKRMSQITTTIPEDSARVDQATQSIRSEIEQTLGSLGVKLRPEFDTSILGAELLDTGSTGRHTNTPGDFDFDLSLKLDAKDFPKAAEFAQAIKSTMVFAEDISHAENGGYYQLRVKGVTSINGKRFVKPLDIDIGFANKSDLSVYGSHDAIRDKLDHIKSHFGQRSYELAIANIILTKQVLKEGHAYKKLEDGGFGGIGVENWILANGGNMEEAFKSFRDAAYENGQRIPYEKFKEKYRILDPGANIKFGGHDNFISVLKPSGYEAMLNTIQAYLG